MARIDLWVESRGGRPAVNPMMRAVLDELRRRGHGVGVTVPESFVVGTGDVPGRPDLVLLKTSTPAALSAAAAAEAGGTAMLNTAAASVRVADKAAALALLAAAGLPVPVTFLLPSPAGPVDATDTTDAAHTTDEAEPVAAGWVRKPVDGIHGRGVSFHADLAGALDAGGEGDAGTPHLLQARVGGTEPDVKVYAVGSVVFAGRKAFGPGSHLSDVVEPVDLTPHEHEVVVEAGRACGLDVVGVDLRRDERGPRIIDVNAFPGFRGFPEAVPSLVTRAVAGLRRPW